MSIVWSRRGEAEAIHRTGRHTTGRMEMDSSSLPITRRETEFSPQREQVRERGREGGKRRGEEEKKREEERRGETDRHPRPHPNSWSGFPVSSKTVNSSFVCAFLKEA